MRRARLEWQKLTQGYIEQFFKKALRWLNHIPDHWEPRSERKEWGTSNLAKSTRLYYFSHGTAEQSLNAYGNPPLLYNSKNSWKMHVAWTTNDGGKNQRHRAGRGTRVQTALQPRVQCTNLWLCSPARLAALGTPGRVGVSRCTKMAQRATIWSLSQGELRACVWPEFLQLGLLLAE